MEIKELYNSNEEITVESYLNKFGVKDVEEYLHPSGKYIDNPMSYKNMRDAVQLVKYHILQSNPMYIIQDPDFDGIASSCILFQYLHLLSHKLNIKLNIKVLIHEGKKRGLGDEKIFNLIKDNPRALVFIPDAGTNETKETRELFDMGIDFLILDHHDILTPIDCGVLVNNQIGNVDKQGSGTVVTHQFLRCLDLEFNVKYSSQFIDLVALSIISDSMDITSLQNRTYLYFGLFKPNSIKNEFIQAMIDRFIFHEDFTIKDLSWSIIPKFNAIVRCKDITLKQNLFLALLGRYDIDDALDICEEAHKNQINNVKEFVENHEAETQTDNNLVVISSDDLLQSYSGLIAGKFSEKTKKPCVVGKTKDGFFIGSLRSPIDLSSKINETNLAEVKGHEKASGFFIKEENIPKLIDFVNNLDINSSNEIEVLKSYYTSEIPKNMFSMFNELNLWDKKFLPKPLFHVKGIEIKSKDITIMKEKHLKFKYKDVEFIYFNANKELREQLLNIKNLNLEVIGELSINEWRGKKTKQVIIQDLEIQANKEKGMEDIF